MVPRLPGRRPANAGELLVRCLREPDAGAPTDQLRTSLAASDLETLVRVANEHGLLPLLAVLLRDADVGEPTATTLKAGRYGQLIRHQIVMEELGRVQAALDGADVPWVVVKGPVLSAAAYPRPDLRAYGDLDLLVPPTHFGRAIDALTDNGALLVDRNWPLAHAQMRGELTLTLPRGSVVDLHWHLLNEPGQRREFRLDPTAMVARRRPLALGATPAWTLDPEDTLLHLAVHTLLGGMRRLVWLNDLRMAHRAFGPDHELVRERARAAGLELVVAAVVQRAVRILGADELRPLASPSSGTAWLRLLRGVDRVRPPQRHGTGALSLAHVASSTRSTGTRSAASLSRWAVDEARALVRDPDSSIRRRGRPAPPQPSEPNPLHRQVGDDTDRQRYLTAVAAYRTG